MIKIMLDNCAIDHLIEKEIDVQEFIEKTSKKYEYYTTTIQIEEIAQTPDDKKEVRIDKTLFLMAFRPIIVNTDFVFDACRFGFCEFSFEEDTTYESIKGDSGKRVNDALIASAAKKNGCILVTDDNKLTKYAIKERIKVISTNDFYNLAK